MNKDNRLTAEELQKLRNIDFSQKAGFVKVSGCVFRSFSKKCLTFIRICAIIIRHSNGLVAQLGERRVRNAEVEGSIPFGSISI